MSHNQFANRSENPLDWKYELAVSAHRDFFAKNSQIKQVHGVIKRFREEYDANCESCPFQCNITHFPSRSRIFLLKKLVEFNLSRYGKAIFVTWQLDNMTLRTRMQPERVQRGNIYVYDIGTYDEIQEMMNNICRYVRPADVVRAIRAARTVGRAITQDSLDYFSGYRGNYHPQLVEDLNRFMFLWDCETARRLQIPAFTDDPERDQLERNFNALPVAIGISSVHYFVEQGFDFKYYLDKNSQYHFFTGEPWQRENALKNVMKKRRFATVDELHRELIYEFGED